MGLNITTSPWDFSFIPFTPSLKLCIVSFIEFMHLVMFFLVKLSPPLTDFLLDLGMFSRSYLRYSSAEGARFLIGEIIERKLLP